MAKKADPVLRPHPLVEALVRPDGVPNDSVLVTGFLGKGGDDEWRLYTDVELRGYVAFKRADVLHQLDMTTPDNPLGGTAIWLKAGADVRQVAVDSRTVAAEFLRGLASYGLKTVTRDDPFTQGNTPTCAKHETCDDADTCRKHATCGRADTCLQHKTCGEANTCLKYDTCGREETCDRYETCADTCDRHPTCGNADTCLRHETCGNADTCQRHRTCNNENTCLRAHTCGNDDTCRKHETCGDADTCQRHRTCGNANTCLHAQTCDDADTCRRHATCGEANTCQRHATCDVTCVGGVCRAGRAAGGEIAVRTGKTRRVAAAARSIPAGPRPRRPGPKKRR